MERYKTIKNHPGYEVSNLGNIRNKKTGTVRALTNRSGYRKIRLDNQDESVHRLVAETFFEGPFDGMQVNHLDGDKSNNFLGNLEWVTPSENIRHAYATSLKRHSGGIPPIGVYDESTGKQYESLVECANDIGGTRQGILYSIRHGRLYKGRLLRLAGDSE